jgi:chromosome partitioning protein
MSVFIAVANRKGGVGKSTVTAMLAHSLATWGGYTVLVLDLDAQANASLILLGDHRWVEARQNKRTVADVITTFKLKPRAAAKVEDYIIHDAGDVVSDRGDPAPISAVAGSFEGEEREREILHAIAKSTASLAAAEQKVTERIYDLLKTFDGAADVILMDCPPGVSFTSEAALQLADKVIVPFRPDYVSIFAVNRIATTIEKGTHAQVQEIPFNERRYVTLANLCQENTKHVRIIREIAVDHPILKIRLPQINAIADAFDWRSARRSMAKKYGVGLAHIKPLHEEVCKIIESIKISKKEGR